MSLRRLRESRSSLRWLERPSSGNGCDYNDRHERDGLLLESRTGPLVGKLSQRIRRPRQYQDRAELGSTLLKRTYRAHRAAETRMASETRRGLLRLRPRSGLPTVSEKHRDSFAQAKSNPGCSCRGQQQSSQGLARNPSIPSDMMIGTMQSAATGSAHHHPSVAFNNTPTNAIIDR